jgi:hypothetical protein
MTLKSAALKVLQPHVTAMRSYAKAHPLASSPSRRGWPTARFVWRRYVTSMITVQTRSTPPLWIGLSADPAWNALRWGGSTNCPSRSALASLLTKHRIRFPEQKAERIRRAVDRDFEGLASEMRNAFARVHDRRASRERRRTEEVRIAVLLQKELAGCGVAPKVARLAFMGAPEVTQVIPIDSRWINALREAGHTVEQSQLAHEEPYREIEATLCEVCDRLGVRPTLADGIPFGWLLGEGV